MMLRKINGVAKANGLEDRVDIVISVFTFARNGKSNIDVYKRQGYEKFDLTMHCYLCSLVNDSDITLLEHEAAKWLSKENLYSVDWLSLIHI